MIWMKWNEWYNEIIWMIWGHYWMMWMKLNEWYEWNYINNMNEIIWMVWHYVHGIKLYEWYDIMWMV